MIFVKFFIILAKRGEKRERWLYQKNRKVLTREKIKNDVAKIVLSKKDRIGDNRSMAQ